MSKLTMVLFLAWSIFLVLWIVLLLLPDPNVPGAVIGIILAIMGLIAAYRRRRTELRQGIPASTP